MPIPTQASSINHNPLSKKKPSLYYTPGSGAQVPGIVELDKYKKTDYCKHIYI